MGKQIFDDDLPAEGIKTLAGVPPRFPVLSNKKGLPKSRLTSKALYFLVFYSAVMVISPLSALAVMPWMGVWKESIIFWEMGSSSSRWMVRRRFRAP